MDNHHQRIGNTTAVMMICVALFFDALQILATVAVIGVVIGPLVSLFAFLTFFTWFKIKGIPFVAGRKRVGVWVLTGLAEFLPLLGAIPAVTLGIIAVILITKAEDKALSEERQQQLYQLIRAAKERDLKEARNIKQLRPRPQVDNIQKAA